MNGKYYVGTKVSSFDRYNDEGPVAGVRVMVDDENAYIAGDQTGYVMEVECPYGTQEMADNLLSSLSGITYKGYRADAAELSPEAELGDGVDVNGVYSVLAFRKVEFGPGHMSEIAAPGDNEAEHEYDYTPQSTKELNYQIAKTRSLISKTAEEIRLEVKNDVEGLSSSISVKLDSITARIDGAENSIEVAISTLDGLTVTDSGGMTKIKGSSIETGTLYVDAANVTGTLSASQINLTGAISWSDLNTDAQSQVTSAQTAASNAQSTANSAANAASYALSTASDLANGRGGGTFINGQTIQSPTITGGIVTGAVINFGSSGATGSLYYTTGSDGKVLTDLIQLESSGGIVLYAATNMRFEGTGLWINIDISDIHVKNNGVYVTLSSLLS